MKINDFVKKNYDFWSFKSESKLFFRQILMIFHFGAKFAKIELRKPMLKI